ncbi:hypothetical protein DICPUDRAFT_96510 [Dictyostelium purpureum]|uniref:IPT/TIG domain-containing protein n=1 Tax=Dictyostelium purpureum TaxID=5786 RepID=F0Z8Y1_DICPU|nr:uncharacterized protein DICPUDRAFT_96510 [Dictyostelium purpureum]EGC39623.1 hypothetical protein DICPUDRAFT_96510 [Dictyostelium purpureum]|eukprot:XP_003283844.1 hypothetical protein DICPUDRAFT_96510 [Dictyostelium purpureum]
MFKNANYPNIKYFKYDGNKITYRTENSSSFYKNITLYEDIGFSKKSLTLPFMCEIVKDGEEKSPIRHCTLDLKLYEKNELFAKSIDSCIIFQNETESECNIVINRNHQLYPLIINKITPPTSGGLVELNGHYLSLDSNYLLYDRNNDEYKILKQIPSKSTNNNSNHNDSNKNIIESIFLEIPPGSGKNHSIILNRNFKKIYNFDYQEPIIYNSSNNLNTITLYGSNFYNNINLTKLIINNQIIDSNIISIDHNKIIFNYINNKKYDQLNIQIIVNDIISHEKYFLNFNNNNGYGYNNNNNQIIFKINDLSKFKTHNGILILNGNNFNNNKFKYKIIIESDGKIKRCSKIQVNSTNIIALLPDGYGDNNIVKVYYNEKIIESSKKLSFNYLKSEIKNVSGLNRNGGVITIYGVNFANPFKAYVGEDLCSTPKLIFHKNSIFTKNSKPKNNYQFDKITCYIGPIFNEVLEKEIINLEINNKNSTYITEYKDDSNNNNNNNIYNNLNSENNNDKNKKIDSDGENKKGNNFNNNKQHYNESKINKNNIHPPGTLETQFSVIIIIIIIFLFLLALKKYKKKTHIYNHASINNNGSANNKSK